MSGGPSLWIVRFAHWRGNLVDWRGNCLDLSEDDKEAIMFFLQIVACAILAVVLFLAYLAVSSRQKSREVRQSQVTIVIGNLVKNVYQDTYSFVTEYGIGDAIQGRRAPTVIFKRFFDGNEDIQIGSTSGRVEIEHFGKYKRALLEEALKDIRGQLVDKNV